METAVATGRSPLAASLTTCALLLKHSPVLLGLNAAAWAFVDVLLVAAKLPAPSTAMVVVGPIAVLNLLFLRAELMMGPALLPAPRGALSLAVAVAASALTLGGMAIATLVALPFGPPDLAAFVTWASLGVALAGAFSVTVDLPDALPVLASRPALASRLGWALFFLFTLRRDSHVLSAAALVGWAADEVRRSRAASPVGSSAPRTPAPVLVTLDLSRARTPEGALRVLLGAQWEWLAIVVVVPLALWLTLTIQGTTDLRWEGVGYGLAGLVSLLLPVSPLGMAAATEALRLPLSPLTVQHAVLRAAANRALALFSGLSVVTAVVMAAEGASPGEIAATVSWSVPLSALAVGSAGWTLHPRSLGVTAVRLAFACVIPLPLLAAFFFDRRLEAGLVIGAIGLLALVASELWARLALAPRRTS